MMRTRHEEPAARRYGRRFPVDGARGRLLRWARAASWTVALTTSLAVGTARGQGATGQVTMFTITQPDPMQTQMTPLRTSRDFFVIQFSHNGSSGSYFINTMGADIEGSTFDGGPNQTVQSVAAGFDTDGVKSINLVLFQTRFNITFQTTNPTQIQFDSTPPMFEVQRVLLDGDMGPPTQFSAGQTIFTSNANLQLQGTVTDPDNGSPSSGIQFNATVDGETSTFMGSGDDDGTFDGGIQLGDQDGEKVVNLTAQDSFPDDMASQPNVSEPLQLRVVLDTSAAQFESVTIIRNPNDPVNRVELPAGDQTFVGRDAVNIRAVFSEPLRMQPVLTITQMDGAPIRATPQQNLTVDNRIFVWSYTPVPQDAQNGPAQVTFSSVFDRAGNETTDDPLLDLAPGFRVDTIPPTRIRFDMQGPGDVVSDPADGSRVGREDFPEVIRVFVEDYDTRDMTTTANASGVRFDTVERAAPGSSMNPNALTIRLISPEGEVPGSPSIAPPSGIFFNLPDFTDPELMLMGFRDVDGDGVAEPIEGAWQIEVGLVDEVGNTNTETFLFTVDTTPIDAGTLIVNVTNPDANPNPLVVGTPSCLGGMELQDTSASPTVTVSSTDPTFSTTRSSVQWLSRIAGPGATPVVFDTDPPTRDPATGIEIMNIREPGQGAESDNFPVAPNVPGQFLPPGTLDPRLGISDGIHLVRVIPEDDAGNRGVRRAGRNRDFIDFEVNLDTVTPFTRRTFPADNEAINEPLRFVDAIIIDPESPANGNEGCGVDVNQSNLQWFLDTPYRPDDVDDDLVDANMRMNTVLRFIHMPNNTDPTLPSFNPNDDAFRVLLELVDQNGFVRSLPTDGTMDGIYRIRSVPVDQAGNTLGDGDRRGTYFGLQADPSNRTTIDLVDFFFLYDTIDPEVTVQDLPEGAFIGGPDFVISGDALDLSAQDQADMGGSGIDRVEMVLEVVDENGNPIPDVPAMASTTNPAVFMPPRRNPVVPRTLATLSPITDESRSPVRTTSMPYDAAFAQTQRERRSWTLRGTLPPRDELLRPSDAPDGTNARYRLRITAFDRAGNSAVINRRVVVSTDHLRPPQPTEPRCGSFVNRPAVIFEWAPVPGASTYTFEITDPNGAVIRRRVTQPMTMQTLITQGEYRWRVATMDSAGNLGAFSSPCIVRLDRNSPEVLSVEHMDPVEPNRNNGVIDSGQVVFTIRFTEELDTEFPISVSLDPQGAVGVGPQQLTTDSFSGDTWVGRVSIPANADPARWDGLANLRIAGATDFAGNVLELDRNRTVEIDTGPFYQTRFFVSPFNDREVTVSILASEALFEPPSLSNVQGADLIDFSGTGARPRANPVPNQPRQSFVTLRLRSTTIQSPTVSFDLTGEDLELNDSRRTISFQVIRPSRESSDGTSGSASSITARGMAIHAAAGSSGGRNVFVFPPPMEGGTTEEVAAVSHALSAEQGGGGEAGGSELVDLGFTETVQSNGPLTGAIRVAVRAPASPADGGPVPCRQVGLYQLVDGEWVWLGGCDEEGNVSGTLRAFGPMKLAQDAVPPQVAAETPPAMLDHAAPGTEISWRVQDAGSGLDPASVRVHVAGRALRHRVDPAQGRVVAEIPGDLPAGEHQVELEVADRSGNAVRAAPMAMTSGGAFGFSDPPLAAPNPARTRTTLRFDLTQPSSTHGVTAEIFDAAGRRVRTLRYTGVFTARDNRMDWDLRDSRGRLVANGVYLFRIRARGSAGSATRRGKIAVLR